MLRKLAVLTAGVMWLLSGVNLVIAVLRVRESPYPKKIKVKVKLK